MLVLIIHYKTKCSDYNVTWEIGNLLLELLKYSRKYRRYILASVRLISNSASYCDAYIYGERKPFVLRALNCSCNYYSSDLPWRVFINSLTRATKLQKVPLGTSLESTLISVDF